MGKRGCGVPYKNIVFVKLEKRLLNDHRWYMMSENSQLIYIKLILLAAETYNKIPQNDSTLREALRSRLEIEIFKNCLSEIELNFPKFKRNKHFRYFAEFENKTNYRHQRDYLGKSQGVPRVGAEKEKEEDKDKEKNKSASHKTDEEFLNELKTTYDWVDIQTELKKIDGWLSAHPGRQKTRRFIINWLNKVDKPIHIQPKEFKNKKSLISRQMEEWEKEREEQEAKICPKQNV